jgi:hypothetical protein
VVVNPEDMAAILASLELISALYLGHFSSLKKEESDLK